MVFVSELSARRQDRQTTLRSPVWSWSRLLYSLVIILNKKISDVDAYQKTIIQLVSSAVALIPYLLVTGGFKDVVFNVNLVLLLLVVGIIHTGVVYALYFGSMSGLKAQTISTLSYIDPVVAMIMSRSSRETMTVWGVIGPC